MKKIILLTLLLAIGLTTAAQTKYQKGMSKAFEIWKTNAIEASQHFERIAKAEPGNWLPSYYAAQTLILDGFSKMKDKEVLKNQLDLAQVFLNDASAISKNNPEIIVLQALLYTVYVASDGATYGMVYSPKVMGLYAKAEQIAPQNPRVVLNKAEWQMGSARFFGQDTAVFCKDIARAVELFVNFKAETEFYPDWGQKEAQDALKRCEK